jgi:hypothetical protein
LPSGTAVQSSSSSSSPAARPHATPPQAFTGVSHVKIDLILFRLIFYQELLRYLAQSMLAIEHVCQSPWRYAQPLVFWTGWCRVSD